MDSSALEGNGDLSWIKSTIWPDDTVQQLRVIQRSGIPTNELETLANLIQGVLKMDYWPPHNLKGCRIFAVEGYYEDNDCIFLEYRPGDLANIRILDGGGLSVTVLFEDETERLSKQSLSGDGANQQLVEKWILWNVRRLLDIPEDKPQGSPLRIEVNPSGVGALRTGRVLVGEESRSHADWYSQMRRYWYSQFFWWTDGRSVTFLIAKWPVLHPNYDYEHMAHIPREMIAPRKFSLQESTQQERLPPPFLRSSPLIAGMGPASLLMN